MTSRRSVLSGALAATAVLLAGCGVDRRAAAREAAFEQKYPPLGPIIDVNGVPTHVLVRGEGPDLVMIHGASANLRDWTFQLMDRLAPRYRCIAFDRPGLGWSAHLRPGYARAFSGASESPSEQAAHLAAAYARVARGAPPIVMGHSYGGTVALAWGLDHPARALVPLSAPSQPGGDGLGAAVAIAASATGGGLAVPLVTAAVRLERTREFSEAVFAPEPVPRGYHEAVGAPLALRRDSLRTNARQVDVLGDRLAALAPRWGELAMPVELVHGAADMAVPAARNSAVLARQVATARLDLVAGAGHMVHQTRPEAIVAAVDRAARRAGL